MSDNQNATVLVTLPKPHLHILRKMAAEQNFNNPDKKISAAGLGREIICQFVDNLDPEIKTRLTSAGYSIGGKHHGHTCGIQTKT